MGDVKKMQERRNMPIMERFFLDVQKTEGCWLWNGVKHRGYGRFHVRGVNVMSHRFLYELYRKPIPAGLTLDHLCRVPSCVNPWHMEAVTQSENTRRADPLKAIIDANRAKTHCIRGHELSGNNIKLWRGARICVQCRRITKQIRKSKRLSKRFWSA